MTYADMLRPTARTSRLLFDLAVVLGGSLVVAASAQIRVPLGFSPVPITGQTLAVLLVGALLGSRRGAASMLTYLFEGTLGLPVFAGGASGSPHLLGPTGGYLVGFVADTSLAGLPNETGTGGRELPSWECFSATASSICSAYPGWLASSARARLSVSVWRLSSPGTC